MKKPPNGSTVDGEPVEEPVEYFEEPRLALRNLVEEVLQRHPSVLNKWNALQVAVGVFFNQRLICIITLSLHVFPKQFL
jgi:hypothetical protein